jgi:hypothetical protein
LYFRNVTLVPVLHLFPIWQTKSAPSPSFTNAPCVSGAGPRVNRKRSTPTSTPPSDSSAPEPARPAALRARSPCRRPASPWPRRSCPRSSEPQLRRRRRFHFRFPSSALPCDVQLETRNLKLQTVSDSCVLHFRPYLAGPACYLLFNQGSYLRSSSQGTWMEELRAHLRCADSQSAPTSMEETL